MRRRAPMVVGSVAALAVVLAACGPDTSTAPMSPDPAASVEPTSIALDDCAPQNLTTLVSGTFSVATTKPLEAPWFEGEGMDDPTGFAPELIDALAKELGFSRLQVSWELSRGSVLPMLAPQEPQADVAIDAMAIADSPASPVAFSEPYYRMNQALIVRTDSTLAGVQSTRELAGARLGAVGSEAASFTTEVIRPRAAVRQLDEASAVGALRSGAIDAIVVDLPDAAGMLAGREDLVLVGQFPPGSAPTGLGLVLAPGNPLMDCVNDALAALEENGTLTRLADEWLALGNSRIITVD